MVGPHKRKRGVDLRSLLAYHGDTRVVQDNRELIEREWNEFFGEQGEGRPGLV